MPASNAPPAVSVPDRSNCHEVGVVNGDAPVLDTDISSPLGEQRQQQGTSSSRPQSSSTAAAAGPLRPQSSSTRQVTGVSNSMASFGQSDATDVVRVDDDDDDDMMVGGHEDDDSHSSSSPTTSLELALSMAVERPSTAEVVVPGGGGGGGGVRPGSSSSSPGTTQQHNNNQSFSSSHHFEGGGSCDSEFSTMIEVGIASEQGARNTMEDRHLARLGDAKAAKNTGAGLLKSSLVSPPIGSTTPSSASSPNALPPLPPSTASKSSAADGYSAEGSSMPGSKSVPASTTNNNSADTNTNTKPIGDEGEEEEHHHHGGGGDGDGGESSITTSSTDDDASSGVDVSPDYIGTLAPGKEEEGARHHHHAHHHHREDTKKETANNNNKNSSSSQNHQQQVNDKDTKCEDTTGTDAHRGASPKQGTTRGAGGVSGTLKGFHRAPSPATRRKRDQEQQQQRDEEEEASLRAEVEVMPEEQLAQGIPFFAVYDGHGGTKCASYLRMKLAQFVLSHPKLVTQPEEAVSEGILAAEEEFLRLFGETDASGATAAVALFVGDSLVTANVGDTEIVLSRSGKATLLSSKHTPKDNPDEKQRVIDAGGRVVHGGRVGHPRFNPNVLHVALSRAMGDAPFKLPELTLSKPSGIIATPATFTTPIHPQDEFVIIGCDGLWDVFTYQEAVDIGRRMLLGEDDHHQKHTAQSIAEALVHQAIQAGSSDNVTVLFLLYKQRPRSASHRPPSAIAKRWQQQSPPPTTPPTTPPPAQPHRH